MMRRSLLDAAQVVGWLELDFASLEADFIAFGGHKGLQGLWGIGGLYMAEGAGMRCSSASCEISYTARKTDRLARPGYCDVGSVDQIALAGLHAAVQWWGSVDRSEHINLAREQIRNIEIAIKDAGARCYGIQESLQRMPSVAFSFEGRTSTDVALALNKHGIVVGSGLQCSPLAHQTMGTDGEGLVRVSVGVGQDANDVLTAIEAIKRIVAA